MQTHHEIHDYKGDVAQLSWKLRLVRQMVQTIDRISPELSTGLVCAHFMRPRRKKDADYVHLLPTGAHEVAVVHRGLTLAGWMWGKSGPAVLLVHGWESHVGRMVSLVQPLLDAGYRVVAFDAPGHGLSPNASTHVVDIGNALQQVIEQFGPFEAIIAHSLGAAATAIMLAREPHLTPEKLVLLSPMRDLAQQLDIFADVARLSPSRKQRLEKRVAQQVGLSLAQCSTVQAAHTLKVPGLVIHDCDDHLVPYAGSETISQQWPGAELIATHRLGHRLGLQNSDVIAHILRFLQKAAHPARSEKVTRLRPVCDVRTASMPGISVAQHPILLDETPVQTRPELLAEASA